MAAEEAPSALNVMCPGCGELSLHTVLKGRQSRGGAVITVDATVQCEECQRVHHVIHREAAPVDVLVIISKGSVSRKAKVQLALDEDIEVGEAFIVEGMNCKLSGIDDIQGRRVDAARVADVKTLWMKEFEDMLVKWAINLGHKTITKVVPARPEDAFTVGEERVFGRLRVTVHAIKTEEKLLRRGSADAGEIVRVFAAPAELGDRTHRPDKRTRAALRETEAREERR